MTKPKFLDDEAFKCLREGNYEAFNNYVKNRDLVDLGDCNLRGTDFRNADLSKVKLAGAYLRDADLRGQDLRHMDLTGCSLFHAKISGVWFPDNVPLEEIEFSVNHGTRIRTMAPVG